jgi:plastocyanin
MTTIEMDRSRTDQSQVSILARLARAVFALLAWLFLISVVLQVLFAGMGVLVDSRYWDWHRTLGSTISLPPLVMLVAGLVGRLPGRMVALSLLAYVLVASQYVFLWLMPAIGLPMLRALHAVNALAFFWVGLYLARRAWQLLHAPYRLPVLAIVVLLVAVGAGGAAAMQGGAAAIDPPPAGGQQGSSAAAEGMVRVVATNFAFALDPAPANAGAITFAVTNDSPIPHDFAIRGEGVDEQTPMLDGGQSGSLAVELRPGTYTYLCTVPGHESLGMKGTITVR